MSTQKPSIDDLDFETLAASLRTRPGGKVLLVKKLLIPEADILCCVYRGKRFNVNFDRDYGVSIHSVDRITEREEEEILSYFLRLSESGTARPARASAPRPLPLSGLTPRAARFIVHFSLLLALALAFDTFAAERLKDLASVQGVRNNQLVGYGLVVGLDGTGDQTTQTPFTTQSIINMLAQLGTTLPTTQSMQLKNVASVMVTANLPPFARIGQQIDVTVSSMGNAKSLRGGTLIMTPLKGADGQIYAQAQGNLMVGGAGAQAGGSSAVVNHLLAGRIASGATVEREVPTALGSGPFIQYEMATTDFGTTQRAVDAINREMGAGTAQALDGRVIRVIAPTDADTRVAFMGRLENIAVVPAKTMAKVIVNPRTGSVVMNQMVKIESCAVAHGALSVVVNSTPQVSQPNALAGGETVATQQADISIQDTGGSLMSVRSGADLAQVIKAINALGAKPQDLLSILQAMKAAGALRAELEII